MQLRSIAIWALTASGSVSVSIGTRLYLPDFEWLQPIADALSGALLFL